VKLQKKLEGLGGMRRQMIKLEGKFAPLYTFSCWEVACIFPAEYKGKLKGKLEGRVKGKLKGKPQGRPKTYPSGTVGTNILLTHFQR
jgi:hypothetical protein